MTNIALIGCGQWGKFILRDLKLLDTEVVVVARSPASQANAKRYGADTIVPHLDQLPEVDAYVIAVPTAIHAECILSLIGKNRPIFCEKPLTADISSAKKIVEIAGDHLFVMDKWRYHSGILALKAIASSEELGPLQGIRTTRVQWNNPHNDVDMDWILMPHDLSIALEILGHLPEPETAHAERSAEGRLVSLTGSLTSNNIYIQFETGIRSPTHRRHIELRCRDGIATLSDAYSHCISLLRTDGGPTKSAPPLEQRPINTDMPLLKALKTFVNYVQHNGPPPKSCAKDALMIIEHIAALRQMAGLPS